MENSQPLYISMRMSSMGIAISHSMVKNTKPLITGTSEQSGLRQSEIVENRSSWKDHCTVGMCKKNFGAPMQVRLTQFNAKLSDSLGLHITAYILGKLVRSWYPCLCLCLFVFNVSGELVATFVLPILWLHFQGNNLTELYLSCHLQLTGEW